VEQINVEVQKWESIEVCFVATNCKGKRQTKIRTSDLKINWTINLPLVCMNSNLVSAKTEIRTSNKKISWTIIVSIVRYAIRIVSCTKNFVS